MSIQFSCPKCQHVMEVADGDEGRKTRCPQCETILNIPGTPVLSSDTKPTPPRPPANLGKPQPLRVEDNAGGDAAAVNPFESPIDTFSQNQSFQSKLRQKARVKLLGPAIGLIVVVPLAAFIQTISQIHDWDATMAQMEQLEGNELRGYKFAFYGMMFYMPISWMFMLMGAAASILVRFKGLAWTGFILGLIPCSTNIFCILTLPISIWGIVVLRQNVVRSAFRA